LTQTSMYATVYALVAWNDWILWRLCANKYRGQGRASWGIWRITIE